MNELKKLELLRFEKEVARRFEAGEINGPVHLSGNNEDQLIEIFQKIAPWDYVFSTHRNHYHALLHGINPESLMAEIRAGHSMNIFFPEQRFFTSSIVGGILPIAVGVAAALKRQNKIAPTVWAFVGDMCSNMGIFDECYRYARAYELPITFVIEDNDVSTNTPTQEVWGKYNSKVGLGIIRYHYDRIYPHYGSGKNVQI
ncbi:MAG: thiamine pyrophosphate-dependent enzyme [Candidatus Helarchaeota archaeon]|nr:thiamine pyrophosphate-dependent enzyme [Candidatus Helarchaeota archaeon]